MNMFDLIRLGLVVLPVWAILGWILWMEITPNESEFSLPQLIVSRFLFGPILWLYSIWQLLGLFGRR